MKTKYNNSFPMEDNRTERHNSYIQMYLLDEISCMLAPSARQITKVKFEDIYIHNADMEKSWRGTRNIHQVIILVLLRALLVPVNPCLSSMFLEFAD